MALNADAPKEIENRIKTLNERLSRYIPPRETWTPAEEALFKPIDPHSVPLEDARAMQLGAIKHTFTRHYKLNQFYRSVLRDEGLHPSGHQNVR